MQTNIHFWSYLAHFFLEWKMLRTKVVEKIKTHILYSVTFSENRAVCEIMGKNIVQRDRPHMEIWRIRISCWIPKATNTHSEYIILIVFHCKQWLYESASILPYTSIACLVLTCLRADTGRYICSVHVHVLQYNFPFVTALSSYHWPLNTETTVPSLKKTINFMYFVWRECLNLHNNVGKFSAELPTLHKCEDNIKVDFQ